MTTTEKLAAIKNHPTRYEIVAEHAEGKRYLVGYTARKSRYGLLRAMQNVGNALIEQCQIGESDKISWHTRPHPHCFTSGWCIGFTGRTQRDTILTGEPPYVATKQEG